MVEQSWMPRPWNAELAGCLWLPRMLDKGRRAIESEEQGRDLMGGYLFGDSDFIDAKLLKFLGTNDARVLALLHEYEDNLRVAEVLIGESGRSAEEVRAWGVRFRRLNALVIPMLEADEGRRKSGLGTNLYRLFYNYVLMPPVYAVFRRAERRRLK